MRIQRFLLFCLVFSVLQGCSSAVNIDLSTPWTTFDSFKSAVAAWDRKAMYSCMHDSHMDVVSYEAYAERISPRKAELQGCFGTGVMGGRTLDEGDRIIFDINGCAEHPVLELSFLKHGNVWSIFYF
jgi:hypothetical protein